MRDNLIRYVDLLFAGTLKSEDIKQEILQNTLDRYDDLISQGKSPEAAYQLAISGIGDISEILRAPTADGDNVETTVSAHATTPAWKKVVQAIGICLYILCPLPLFLLQNVAGLCGLLVFVAIATALMVIASGKENRKTSTTGQEESPKSELHKAVNSTIWIVGLFAYFALSFTLQAWYITWVIFPLVGAVQGLVRACIDLKEAKKSET